MKIRQGFVSNSSTSSYIVCGTKIEDKGKLLEDLKVKFPRISDALEMYCIEKGWSVDRIGLYDFMEELSEQYPEYGDTYHSFEYTGSFLGEILMTIDDSPEEFTLSDIDVEMKRIKKKLESLIGEVDLKLYAFTDVS